MEPLRVVVRRGEITESLHFVHAVAVRHGTVIASAGDTRLVTFMRSAAKPIQALVLARARDDLDSRDLAIASASHCADAPQLDAVRALLAKAQASEDDLECGPEQGSRLRHNCSGKHAGMLALAQAKEWEPRGYRHPDHPVQRACVAEIAAAAEVQVGDLATATDGCGVVSVALTLERMAHAFSRLERCDAGPRVAASMKAHPELIRGTGAPDTELMRRLPGWTAKGGAEGLLCAAGPDGTGMALKVVDGAQRAVGPATAAFLRELGTPVDELAVVAVENSLGEQVGSIAAGL